LSAGRETSSGEGSSREKFSSESLLLATCVFWALACNRSFLGAAMHGSDGSLASTWGFGLGLLVLLVSLNYLLWAPLAWGRWTKPMLTLGLVTAAASSHFIQSLGIYLDPGMLRNVLQTDLHESRELMSWPFAVQLLLFAALPAALIWLTPLRQRSLPRALSMRLLSMALAAVVAVGALWAVFQPLSSLMRNHKDLRYKVTPANVMWSSGAVLAADLRGAAKPRQAIGLDAKPGPLTTARKKPLLVVMVVGETARKANWGLSGYSRQTTPLLAQLPVINFSQAEACGTATEVSLPCMFAPVGRRDYDEGRIRGSESLLHVVARAGVQVRWRDNQSGCKGICDGLPYEEVQSLNPPGLCQGGHCMDEALLSGLEAQMASMQGTSLLVLHPIGNHGPAYYRRFPPAFARFTPYCQQDDLQRCSTEEIVNAYDNALLYTDHFLATLIGKLQSMSGSVDSVLVYMSDHGESLGESGLFLHGMPFAIAPAVQREVPMLMWLSAAAPQAVGLDLACLRNKASAPVKHDHLFHTLLGLLDVQTTLHEAAWDLGAGCKP